MIQWLYNTTFYTKYLQNLKSNVKRKTILHLILVGIPSIFMLFVNNRGVGERLLNRQNLINLTKVIFRQSLTLAELRNPHGSRAKTNVPKFLLDVTLHLQRNYGHKREEWPSGLVTIVYSKKRENEGSFQNLRATSRRYEKGHFLTTKKLKKAPLI